MPKTASPGLAEALPRLVKRHLRIGWFGLLLFLTVGILLEAFHGLKVNYYLDTKNVTRRLMWTLGHAHGTLFSLVNVAFALSLARVGAVSETRLRAASSGLIGGLAFLPAGFLLGGLQIYEGDPGLGIFLVPLGAALFFIGVAAFALDLTSRPPALPEVPFNAPPPNSPARETPLSQSRRPGSEPRPGPKPGRQSRS